MKCVRIVFLVFLALAKVSPLLLLACMTRKSTATSETRAASTAAEYLEPINIDLDLLKNINPPTVMPPNWVEEDVYVPSMPSGSAYSNIMDAAGTSLGNLSARPASDPWVKALVSGPWNVLDYENNIRAAFAKGARQSVPLKFAGASVLKILQKNRKEFGLLKEGSTANVPVFLKRQDLADNRKISDEKAHLIENPLRPFSETRCKGFIVSDYSDIKWHYYCAIPAVFRACQRMGAGQYFSSKITALDDSFKTKTAASEEYIIARAKLRWEDDRLVRSYCLGNGKAEDQDDISTIKEYFSSNESYYGFKPGDFEKTFQEFYNSQVDEDSGVNMYDYI